MVTHFRKVFNSIILEQYMQEKFLKGIVISIAGDKAAGIVEILYGKKNVNEFIIAKKLSLTINQTRNILYSLADEGLVSFIRKKDKKKGGWYTYFWTLNTGKGLLKYKETLKTEFDTLKNLLHSRKTKKFYSCPNCSIEFNEENALLHDYTCPECGEIMQLKESKAEIQSVGTRVEKLEKELADVDKELEIVMTEENKSRTRRLKADEKKKSLERKKNLAKRKKLANKMLKKPKKQKKSKKKSKR